MSITPRPEFGRPETGRVRYWYRTDAQLRRAQMSPEDRALEAKRIGDRRRYVKAQREQRKAEQERRERHGPSHRTCRDCAAGLHDVGITNGHEKVLPAITETAICCVCLRSFTFGEKGVKAQAVAGPNGHLFRCRVLNPDVEASTDDLEDLAS